jgi:hypothetical protein
MEETGERDHPESAPRESTRHLFARSSEQHRETRGNDDQGKRVNDVANEEAPDVFEEPADGAGSTLVNAQARDDPDEHDDHGPRFDGRVPDVERDPSEERRDP